MYTVVHHPDYPECDCSYVFMPDGSELCAFYANGSDKHAHMVADAMNGISKGVTGHSHTFCPYCNPCRKHEELIACKDAMRVLASFVGNGPGSGEFTNALDMEVRIREGINTIVDVETRRREKSEAYAVHLADLLEQAVGEIEGVEAEYGDKAPDRLSVEIRAALAKNPATARNDGAGDGLPESERVAAGPDQHCPHEYGPNGNCPWCPAPFGAAGPAQRPSE